MYMYICIYMYIIGEFFCLERKCYITHPVNYYPSFFISFRLCNIHKAITQCKHIIACCDMQKNSQCKVLHCTFYK